MSKRIIQIKQRPTFKVKIAYLILAKDIGNIILHDHKALLYKQKYSKEGNDILF